MFFYTNYEVSCFLMEVYKYINVKTEHTLTIYTPHNNLHQRTNNNRENVEPYCMFHIISQYPEAYLIFCLLCFLVIDMQSTFQLIS